MYTVDNIHPQKRFDVVMRTFNQELAQRNESIDIEFRVRNLRKPERFVSRNELQILTRAFITILVLIPMAIVTLQYVHLLVGISILFLTLALTQMFAYAYSMETKQTLIHPLVLSFTIVVTFVLMVASMAMGVYALYIT